MRPLPGWWAAGVSISTFGELAASGLSWQDAVGARTDEWDLYSFPYLGMPGDHQCDVLRSRDVSVNVIVSVWNSASTVAACLEALRLSSLNRLAPDRLEVVVCDDGSTDASWSQIATSARGMNVRAYRFPHRSQSAALNSGCRRASGDVLVFCDSDMILGCGALDELAARHERWQAVTCFGFRTDLPFAAVACPTSERLWRLLHTEAFIGDNRVLFDLPTVEPNMMIGTDWLAKLANGCSILDSQGSVWRRHRSLYGCLFSVRRSLLDAACDGFPDALGGWGYNDTLVAARLEAAGSWLMPVTAAWGHHVRHPIRHPAQWFQGARDRLAYEYLLSLPLDSVDRFWRRAARDDHPTGACSTRGWIPPIHRPVEPVRSTSVALLRLGRWEDYLAATSPADDPRGVAECLFRLGRYDELTRNERLIGTLWGALGLLDLGDLGRAVKALDAGTNADPLCAYFSSASVGELCRLAAHYEADDDAVGLGRRYRGLADALSRRTS